MLILIAKKSDCYETKISLQHVLTKFWQPFQPRSNYTVGNQIEVENKYCTVSRIYSQPATY